MATNNRIPSIGRTHQQSRDNDFIPLNEQKYFDGLINDLIAKLDLLGVEGGDEGSEGLILEMKKITYAIKDALIIGVDDQGYPTYEFVSEDAGNGIEVPVSGEKDLEKLLTQVNEKYNDFIKLVGTDKDKKENWYPEEYDLFVLKYKEFLNYINTVLNKSLYSTILEMKNNDSFDYEKRTKDEVPQDGIVALNPDLNSTIRNISFTGGGAGIERVAFEIEESEPNNLVLKLTFYNGSNYRVYNIIIDNGRLTVTREEALKINDPYEHKIRIYRYINDSNKSVYCFTFETTNPDELTDFAFDIEGLLVGNYIFNTSNFLIETHSAYNKFVQIGQIVVDNKDNYGSVDIDGVDINGRELVEQNRSIVVENKFTTATAKVVEVNMEPEQLFEENDDVSEILKNNFMFDIDSNVNFSNDVENVKDVKKIYKDHTNGPRNINGKLLVAAGNRFYWLDTLKAGQVRIIPNDLTEIDSKAFNINKIPNTRDTLSVAKKDEYGIYSMFRQATVDPEASFPERFSTNLRTLVDKSASERNAKEFLEKLIPAVHLVDIEEHKFLFVEYSEGEFRNVNKEVFADVSIFKWIKTSNGGKWISATTDSPLCYASSKGTGYSVRCYNNEYYAVMAGKLQKDTINQWKDADEKILLKLDKTSGHWNSVYLFSPSNMGFSRDFEGIDYGADFGPVCVNNGVITYPLFMIKLLRDGSPIKIWANIGDKDVIIPENVYNPNVVSENPNGFNDKKFIDVASNGELTIVITESNETFYSFDAVYFYNSSQKIKIKNIVYNNMLKIWIAITNTNGIVYSKNGFDWYETDLKNIGSCSISNLNDVIFVNSDNGLFISVNGIDYYRCAAQNNIFYDTAETPLYFLSVGKNGNDSFIYYIKKNEVFIRAKENNPISWEKIDVAGNFNKIISSNLNDLAVAYGDSGAFGISITRDVATPYDSSTLGITSKVLSGACVASDTIGTDANFVLGLYNSGNGGWAYISATKNTISRFTLKETDPLDSGYTHYTYNNFSIVGTGSGINTKAIALTDKGIRYATENGANMADTSVHGDNAGNFVKACYANHNEGMELRIVAISSDKGIYYGDGTIMQSAKVRDNSNYTYKEIEKIIDVSDNNIIALTKPVNGAKEVLKFDIDSRKIVPIIEKMSAYDITNIHTTHKLMNGKYKPVINFTNDKGKSWHIDLHGADKESILSDSSSIFYEYEAYGISIKTVDNNLIVKNANGVVKSELGKTLVKCIPFGNTVRIIAKDNVGSFIHYVLTIIDENNFEIKETGNKIKEFGCLKNVIRNGKNYILLSAKYSDGTYSEKNNVFFKKAIEYHGSEFYYNENGRIGYVRNNHIGNVGYPTSGNDPEINESANFFVLNDKLFVVGKGNDKRSIFQYAEKDQNFDFVALSDAYLKPLNDFSNFLYFKNLPLVVQESVDDRVETVIDNKEWEQGDLSNIFDKDPYFCEQLLLDDRNNKLYLENTTINMAGGLANGVVSYASGNGKNNFFVTLINDSVVALADNSIRYLKAKKIQYIAATFNGTNHYLDFKKFKVLKSIGANNYTDGNVVFLIIEGDYPTLVGSNGNYTLKYENNIQKRLFKIRAKDILDSKDGDNPVDAEQININLNNAGLNIVEELENMGYLVFPEIETNKTDNCQYLGIYEFENNTKSLVFMDQKYFNLSIVSVANSNLELKKIIDEDSNISEDGYYGYIHSEQIGDRKKTELITVNEGFDQIDRALICNDHSGKSKTIGNKTYFFNEGLNKPVSYYENPNGELLCKPSENIPIDTISGAIESITEIKNGALVRLKSGEYYKLWNSGHIDRDNFSSGDKDKFNHIKETDIGTFRWLDLESNDKIEEDVDYHITDGRHIGWIYLTPKGSNEQIVINPGFKKYASGVWSTSAGTFIGITDRHMYKDESDIDRSRETYDSTRGLYRINKVPNGERNQYLISDGDMFTRMYNKGLRTINIIETRHGIFQIATLDQTTIVARYNVEKDDFEKIFEREDPYFALYYTPGTSNNYFVPLAKGTKLDTDKEYWVFESTINQFVRVKEKGTNDLYLEIPVNFDHLDSDSDIETSISFDILGLGDKSDVAIELNEKVITLDILLNKAGLYANPPTMANYELIGYCYVDDPTHRTIPSDEILATIDNPELYEKDSTIINFVNLERSSNISIRVDDEVVTMLSALNKAGLDVNPPFLSDYRFLGYYRADDETETLIDSNEILATHNNLEIEEKEPTLNDITYEVTKVPTTYSSETQYYERNVNKSLIDPEVIDKPEKGVKYNVGDPISWNREYLNASGKLEDGKWVDGYNYSYSPSDDDHVNINEIIRPNSDVDYFYEKLTPKSKDNIKIYLDGLFNGIRTAVETKYGTIFLSNMPHDVLWIYSTERNRLIKYQPHIGGSFDDGVGFRLAPGFDPERDVIKTHYGRIMIEGYLDSEWIRMGSGGEIHNINKRAMLIIDGGGMTISKYFTDSLAQVSNYPSEVKVRKLDANGNIVRKSNFKEIARKFEKYNLPLDCNLRTVGNIIYEGRIIPIKGIRLLSDYKDGGNGKSISSVTFIPENDYRVPGWFEDHNEIVTNISDGDPYSDSNVGGLISKINLSILVEQYIDKKIYDHEGYGAYYDFVLTFADNTSYKYNRNLLLTKLSDRFNRSSENHVTAIYSQNQNIVAIKVEGIDINLADFTEWIHQVTSSIRSDRSVDSNQLTNLNYVKSKEFNSGDGIKIQTKALYKLTRRETGKSTEESEKYKGIPGSLEITIRGLESGNQVRIIEIADLKLWDGMLFRSILDRFGFITNPPTKVGYTLQGYTINGATADYNAYYGAENVEAGLVIEAIWVKDIKVTISGLIGKDDITLYYPVENKDNWIGIRFEDVLNKSGLLTIPPTYADHSLRGYKLANDEMNRILSYSDMICVDYINDNNCRIVPVWAEYIEYGIVGLESMPDKTVPIKVDFNVNGGTTTFNGVTVDELLTKANISGENAPSKANYVLQGYFLSTDSNKQILSGSTKINFDTSLL